MFEIGSAGDLIPHGSINTGGSDMEITGQKLIVLGYGGVKIYDITLPFAPVLVGEAKQKLPVNMARLKLSPAGDIAYIAAGAGGLITVRLTGEAPTQPRVNIVDEGEMHRLHWSADFTGCTLMSAPNVNGPWNSEGYFFRAGTYVPFFNTTFG